MIPSSPSPFLWKEKIKLSSANGPGLFEDILKSRETCVRTNNFVIDCCWDGLCLSCDV